MSRMPESQDDSLRMKRALLALQKLQSKVDALESAHNDPIAIVGMGCRFPGADTPDELWRLLVDGRDAIGEVPKSRWDVAQYYDPDPRAAGKIATPYGGFLDEVDGFDAPFFGIAPREAASLDPQQRLLLEVSWEALEHGGIAPDSLVGSPTGIFIGISSNDFAQSLMARDPTEIDHYMGSGNARSVAAGRLSYVLGLKGPSLAIDTACSSSLVAVHLACESLRRQECEMALAGGVNLLFAPEVSISHSRAQMLAADGRCKTFDASADGFVRSEGCGIVVLKRLATATADRDEVLAVILGSAVNHDGRTSALTVPSGPSQEAVIRAALRNAGIDPLSVCYVEAHGTGTRLGDPIEVGALAAALCDGRPADDPLILGSVKTNIGHLEAGAGIAGLLKVVLASRHQTIPAHLHFREPNPLIPWAQLPIRVAASSMPWRSRGGRRVAGVSSFGFSGTNAHVVVAEAPARNAQSAEATARTSESLLVLSAKTEPALRSLVGRYAEHLATASAVALDDVAYSAATGRSHFAHRLSVTAGSTASCREQLGQFLSGQEAVGVSHGHVLVGERPHIAFLFSGQGSQYPGMASGLYREHATFRAAVDRCEAILQTWMDRRLTEILFDAPADVLNRTKYTQPALFALEYALAALWRSWGVEPDALLGHSVGEYAAACVAELFSLEDGLMLIAARARLMESIDEPGAMVAVLADEAHVARIAAPYASGVSIAALNSRRNVVLSGARDLVNEIVARLTAEEVHTVPLAVSHAFHSPLMDRILADFRDVVARVRFSTPTIDLVSNLTGEIAGDEIATPDYWCRHLRETVRFAAGVQTVERIGCNTCLEIGPKPVLLDLVRQSFTPGAGALLPSLRPGQADMPQMLRSLGTLYSKGASIDWTGFYAAHARSRVALPLYPFERQPYRLAPSNRSRSTPPPTIEASHPLLGSRCWVAGSEEIRYQARIAIDSPSYLADHTVFGEALLPASAYIEMALAAGLALLDSVALTLEDVSFRQPLRLLEPTLVQIVLTPQPDDRIAFRIYSRAEANADATATLHASGAIRAAARDRGRDASSGAYRQDHYHQPTRSPAKTPAVPTERPVVIPSVRATSLDRCRAAASEPVSVEWLDAELDRRGIHFGPAFRAITELWRGPQQAVARIEAPMAVAPDVARYRIHPALLDACSRTSGVLSLATPSTETLLQVGIERLHFYGQPGSRMWASSRVREVGAHGQHGWVADCEVFDDTGACCLVIEGQSARRVQRDAFDGAPQARSEQQYELEWVAKAGRAAAASRGLASPDAIADAVRAEIELVSRDPALAEYGELLLQLDDLAHAYAVHAFEQMGWRFRVGDRFTSSEIAHALRVVEPHLRLFERLLEMLAGIGCLQRVDAQWEVVALPAVPHPHQLRARLSARYPNGHRELSLVNDSGDALADVLRGTVDPLAFLFARGEVNRIGELYENTVGAAATHAVLGAAVATAIDARPGERTLRVLEIGAGTGATTASVLDRFAPERTEYTFTDVSARFLTHAAARFADHPFVQYRVLDIEQPPSDQGFAANGYDLVIATNVLHATKDLRQTLGHVRGLLAADGILIVVEGTSPSPWLDLVFGLLAGWWRFADVDLRPSHPLISATAWECLLAEQGFSRPMAVFAESAAGAALSRQAAIVARRPAKGPTLDIPTEPLAGGQYLLARSARLGPLCEPQHVRDSRNEPHSGPKDAPSPLLEDADHWLIVGHGGGVGTGVAELLTSRGGTCRLLERPEAVVAELARTGKRLRGIVYLSSLDAAPAEALSVDELQRTTIDDSMAVLTLLRAIATPNPHRTRIWLVTRDAQPAGSFPAMSGIASAPLWGMGKVLALEYPEQWGGLIDLPPDRSPADAASVVNELLHGDGEDLVAIRTGERFVARVARRSHEPDRPLPIRSDATYLVTGGLGALGLELVSWMIREGARHVCVVGRSGVLSTTARETVQRFSNAGVEIDVMKADVGDPAQLRRVFAALDGRPPLRGVVHAAGVPASGTLDHLDVAALQSAFNAKIAGTWLLHELTREAPLDFFVLCSSMVAVWGAKGQGDYVAANAFLDACAHYRRARGLPALSVDWGPLTGGGMLPSESVSDLARMGIATQPLAHAGAVVADLLRSDAVQVVVADIDWRLLRRVYQARAPRPLFNNLQGGSTRASTPRYLPAVSALREAPAHERAQVLRDHVQRTFADVLGLSAAQTADPRMGFFDLGMDSLTAMEFRDRLESSLGVSLPSTVALDYSTVETLTAHLLAMLSSLEAPLPAPHADADGETVRRLRELSDAEVEAMLLKKLETL